MLYLLKPYLQEEMKQQGHLMHLFYKIIGKLSYTEKEVNIHAYFLKTQI
jgi:hypothetical protein